MLGMEGVYLKSITLENFKSYKGVHMIGPFYRFTAVIGPNGCGKSNIMDAISFALGVSINQLRSENLSMLINKDSTGTSVSLEFQDFSLERTYVAPHSTFKINGRVVSFDEYKAFMESKNIYVRLRNFLVFQSDLGTIALKSPTEICRIVEEISGSIDLKPHYDRLLSDQHKAMTECSHALELKKSAMAKLKAIEKEKAVEKKFNTLLKKRDELNRTLVLSEIYQKSIHLSDADRSIRTLKEESRKMTEENKGAMSAYNDLKERIFEEEKVMLRDENDILKKREELDDIKIEILREQDKSDKIRWRIRQLNEKKKVESDIVNKKRARLLNLTKELKLAEDEYKAIEKEEESIENLLTDDVKQQFRLEESEFDRKVTDKRERLNKLKCDVIPIKEEKEVFQSSYSGMMEEYRKRSDELREMESQKYEDRILLLKEEKERHSKRISKGLSEYERIVKDEKEKNDKLHEILVEMLAIKQESREIDKKMKIRNVVETLKSIYTGVCGRVIDLIKPTQKKYEIALSSLMTKYEQAVVVEDESCAISCIEYIKENRLCKLTFLPLTTLKVKNKEAFRNENMCRPAVDAVIYDNKYAVVVNFILSDSQISDNVFKAKDLVYTKGMKVKVVSLDGTVFQSNGLITGGGMGNKFNTKAMEELILERNKLIKDLQEIQEKRSLFSDTEIVMSRINMIDKEIGEVQSHLESIRNLKDDLRILKVKLDEAEARIRQYGDNSILREISALESDIKMEEINTFKVFRRMHVGSLDEFKSMVSGNFFKIKKLELFSKISKVNNLINVLNGEIHAISSTNEESIDHPDEGLIKELEERYKACTMELQSLRNRVQAEKISLDDHKNELRNIEKKISTDYLNSKIVSLTSLKMRLQEEINEMVKFAYLEEIEIPLKDVNDRRVIEESISSGDNAANYVNLMDFSSVWRNEFDLDDLKAQILQISKEVDKNIPTLMTGSSEGEEIQKISQEYDNCKARLLKVRTEFNSVRKKRLELFMECFNKISESIGKIYQDLTRQDDTTGNAFLVLENQLEPYNYGIRFHVMPPKKRFREMSYLSGGEKAMSALSLIFAIHSFKPAPFYVFDELDSALDKTNVSKLINFYRTLDVQLIVITLKPQIFQCSDALVGVFRDQRAESSRILTYKLCE